MTSRPQPTRSRRNDDLAVAYKARAGRRAASPTPSAGLELVAPITLQSGNARIVAGRIAHPGPGLLPVGVGAPGATGVVTLDRTPALRHTDLPAGAGASATVFVVPTQAGPEAIACVGAGPSGCEAVAATLRLKTGGALDIRPSKPYATALSAVLAAHARREAADRRALARAGTSTAQGAAAAAAARAQAALAKRARELPAPKTAAAANAAVVAAIAGTATGYRRLAAAAGAHDAGRLPARPVAAVRRAQVAPGRGGRRPPVAGLPRHGRWLTCRDASLLAPLAALVALAAPAAALAVVADQRRLPEVDARSTGPTRA